MILYLHFNWYHYHDQSFRDKLKLCNVKYSVDQSTDFETILESDRFPFMRINLSSTSMVEDVIKEIGKDRIVKLPFTAENLFSRVTKQTKKTNKSKQKK